MEQATTHEVLRVDRRTTGTVPGISRTDVHPPIGVDYDKVVAHRPRYELPDAIGHFGPCHSDQFILVLAAMDLLVIDPVIGSVTGNIYFIHLESFSIVFDDIVRTTLPCRCTWADCLLYPRKPILPFRRIAFAGYPPHAA